MEDLIPTKYCISQNYPNPFRAKTVIKYCLPEKVKVKITILNSIGEKVKELVNQYQDEGTYQIVFDGSNLAEGKYICKIEANHFVGLKLMRLSK